MEYPAYAKYTCTDIDWLNNIPEHWILSRLKFAVNLVNIKIEAKETYLPYMGMENIESFTAKKIYDDDNPPQSEGVGSYFKQGDVLFGKLRPYFAKVHLSKSEGFCSSELLVIEGDEVLSVYLVYLILSDWFIELVNSSTYGAKMPRASWDYIGNMVCPIPDKKEQQKIANFLDYKTQQIDQLIEKKKALIEKLNEQRIAVITQAVTKGIDKNAKMKPSGVDWLGDVPEHWEVLKLKFIGDAIMGLIYEPKDVVNEGEGCLVLRASNIQDALLVNKDNVFVTTKIPEKLITKLGDILICSRNGSRALIGKNALVTEEFEGKSFGAFTTVFRSELNDFLYYVFNSNLFSYQAGKYLTSTINRLTIGVIK